LAKNVAGESNARKTNLEIGHNVDDGPNPMKSVYSNYYSYKKGEIAKLNPEKIKDLRAHHFQLGQMNFGPHVKNTSTEATATYLPKTQKYDLKAEFEKTKEQSRASVSKIFFFNNRANYLKMSTNTIILVTANSLEARTPGTPRMSLPVKICGIGY
jgi:hypothetical protein